MDATTFVNELEPVAERLLNRHLATAKEWFPHELVPWDRAAGRGIDDADRDWKPDMFPMSDGVRSRARGGT